MNCVWTIPWRSSCTSLRCVQPTLLDLPKALFGGRHGGRISTSPGQALRHYAVTTKPLQRDTRCFDSRKLSWSRTSPTFIERQSWLRAQYHSSSASSASGRRHTKLSRVKPPTDRRQKERLPVDPKEFDPEEGVRFRAENLSEKEITSIFGPSIGQDEGNRILRVLHGQRLSGTLDQGLAVPHATAYVESLVATGLTWLRGNYPVDEDAAIMARVDREQAEEEKELLDDASRLGMLPQQSTDKSRLYGASGLDAIREHYESQPIPGEKPSAGRRVEIGKLQTSHENKVLCMYPAIHSHILLVVTKDKGLS